VAGGWTRIRRTERRGLAVANGGQAGRLRYSPRRSLPNPEPRTLVFFPRHLSPDTRHLPPAADWSGDRCGTAVCWPVRAVSAFICPPRRVCDVYLRPISVPRSLRLPRAMELLQPGSLSGWQKLPLPIGYAGSKLGRSSLGRGRRAAWLRPGAALAQRTT